MTNEDLKKLFQKIGQLRVCRFDRNEFGQFLGSATVTYERQEDAKQAITEYHGAFLDDKVLTVEYDMIPHFTKGPNPEGGNSNNSSGQRKQVVVKKAGPPGKTLQVK